MSNTLIAIKEDVSYKDITIATALTRKKSKNTLLSVVGLVAIESVALYGVLTLGIYIWRLLTCC